MNNDFVKTDDGMIINTKIDDFDRYRMARTKAIKDKALVERVDQIEKDLVEIKSLLQKLSSRIS